MSWRLQSPQPLGDGAAVVHQTISKVSDSSKLAVREAAARKKVPHFVSISQLPKCVVN